MSYTTEWKDRMFIARFSGELNGREIMECDAIHDGHEDFDNLLYSIWDFSQISSVNLSIDDVREISAIDRASAISNPKITIILIIQNPQLEKFVELYQSEVADIPWQVKIFKSFDDALLWQAQHREGKAS